MSRPPPRTSSSAVFSSRYCTNLTESTYVAPSARASQGPPHGEAWAASTNSSSAAAHGIKSPERKGPPVEVSLPRAAPFMRVESALL